MEKMTVAIIEDSKSDLEQIKDFCDELEKQENIELKKVSFDSIKTFKEWAKEERPDLMVADLRLGTSQDDRSGWESIKEILQQEITPVVVYSAFSEEEPAEEIFKNLLIVRVPKGGEETEKFKSALLNAIRLKLKFNQEKERIASEFGKLSLETVKEILGEGEGEDLDERTLAIMAVGRLASCLLNVPPGDGEKFPPESAFIYPPLEISSYPKESLFLGDFLKKTENDESSTLWIVVSPSCDLVFKKDREAKISEVFLLRCYRNYAEVPFLKNEGNENNRKNGLKIRIKGKAAKILKCPTRIFGSKYILISFKNYRTLSYNEIKIGIQEDGWKKIATLATPYAESLQGLFISDFSRIGTPETVSSKEEEQWAEEFIKNTAS